MNRWQDPRDELSAKDVGEQTVKTPRGIGARSYAGENSFLSTIDRSSRTWTWCSSCGNEAGTDERAWDTFAGLIEESTADRHTSLFSNHSPSRVMDSLPQELIDEIINNLPPCHLRSSSLVSKQWRRRSQQRALYHIRFYFEHEVDRWCTNISQGSDGVSSYVKFAGFVFIGQWDNPALFGRALKGFTSLTTLSMCETAIPDDMPGWISHEDSPITSIRILFPSRALSTVVSMVLSLPNLREIDIERTDEMNHGIASEELFPAFPVARCKGPLDSLRLYGGVDEAAEVIAQLQFTSRCLYLDINLSCLQRLLTLSSEIVAELTLEGVWS